MSVLAALGVLRLVAQPVDAQRSMQSTPLYKPQGAQRRPIHTLASHAEVARPLVGNVQLDPAASSFVRPDVPSLSDDEGAAGRGSKDATVPVKAFGSNKPFATNAKFRSALEQVSWMTSSAHQAEVDDGRKSNGRLGIGMFGL